MLIHIMQKDKYLFKTKQTILYALTMDLLFTEESFKM